MELTANGITMHYTLEGPAGAPVVTLSHSLATDLGMWDPQLAALKARYRVLRYDTRGHGRTAVPAGAYSLDMLAADARALLRTLDIAKTHWVGLSMGGMIGQTLALAAPDLFTSLSLCDTSSRAPALGRPHRHRLHQGDGSAGGADDRTLVHAALHRGTQGRRGPACAR